MSDSDKIKTSDLAFLTYIVRDPYDYTNRKSALQVRAFEQVETRSGETYFMDLKDNSVYILLDEECSNQRVTPKFDLVNFYTKSRIVEEEPLFFKAGEEVLNDGELTTILKTNEEIDYMLGSVAKEEFGFKDRIKMVTLLSSLNSKNSRGGEEITREKLSKIVDTFNECSCKANEIEYEVSAPSMYDSYSTNN